MSDLFIDIKNSDLKHFNSLFGGRGIGKTFSVKKHKIEWALETGRKFIWLRDTKNVVDLLYAAKTFNSAIVAAFPDFPLIEFNKEAGNIHIVKKDSDGNITNDLGLLMALSTFHNARGLEDVFDSVDSIIWDEFIPEDGVIKNKYQGTLFDNAYETVNRNREMFGRDPVQVVLLSNTNDIYSDVLENWGVSKIIEDMQINSENSYVDNDIWIEFFSNEAFYEKKKNTLQYRLSHNEKFKNMALENKFNNSMALVKRNVDYKGSNGIFNVALKYVCIQLADGSIYFKLGTYKNLMNYDMDNEQEAILFRLIFNDKLRLLYISGQMFFDSIYTQRNILEYAKI